MTSTPERRWWTPLSGALALALAASPGGAAEGVAAGLVRQARAGKAQRLLP